MATHLTQNSPARAKQRILDYLKNRGGSLRCGHYSPCQVIFWKIFQQGRAGSDHMAISAVSDLISELEAAKDVVLQRDAKGAVNYIALPSADPETTAESELSNNELGELIATMSAEYSFMEQKLADMRRQVEEALELAAHYEQDVKVAQEERDAARQEAAKVRSALIETQSLASFSSAKEILAAQEAELSEARKDNRILQLDLAEKLGEVNQLRRDLEVSARAAKEAKDQRDAFEKRIADLSAGSKEARRELEQRINSLGAEVARLERGEGRLSPAKAVAAAAYSISDAMNEIWISVATIMAENCSKYLPEDKRAAFRAEIDVEYNKMRRRNKKS